MVNGVLHVHEQCNMNPSKFVQQPVYHLCMEMLSGRLEGHHSLVEAAVDIIGCFSHRESGALQTLPQELKLTRHNKTRQELKGAQCVLYIPGTDW